MKNFALIPIGLLLLSACNQAELKKSNFERDSLMNIVNEREASLSEFVASFNEVERNLDSVALRQQVIAISTNMHSELKQNQKEKINNEIIAINNLMEQNRKQLNDLTLKLKNSKTKNVHLEKTVITLNNQLVQKYAELETLNKKLSSLNAEVEKLKTEVDILAFQNAVQSEIIVAEIEELQTAYYIVGTSKDLQEAKLIDKKGGLLGIGRTTKLNENLDNKAFIKIDFTKTTNIEINSKNAKIISSHPSDTYTFEKDKKIIKTLIITDPEKFWSISKYLIITKD